MVAFPSSEEIAEYASAHGMVGQSRRAIAEKILADERKRGVQGLSQFMDPDVFAAALKELQDAADEHQVRREVFAAAVPVAARHIITHCLYTLDKDFS